MEIFWDMDGVLADFVRASLQAHGKLNEIPYSEICWDFPAQVGFRDGADPAFWDPLSNKDFWAGLPTHDDGIELFHKVAEAHPREKINLLTSAPFNGAIDGKRDWVKRVIPGYEANLFTGTRKWKIASAGTLLIDDKPETVEQFLARGGRSVLIPRPWNARRDECGPDGEFDVEQLFFEIHREIAGR